MTMVTSVALLAAACGQSSAQGPWSLEKCIDYALEHSIPVRQQQISVAQGEIELNTAQNSRLPSLSGSASENFSFGRGLTADNTYDNSNTTSTSFSLGTDVPVFRGFQIKNNIALSKLNLAAAVSDLDKIKDNIRVSVAQAYVQVLYAQEILQVAKNQVGIDSLQVERLIALESNGRASLAEVAQQKASLSQSRYSVTQASNNLNLALLDLSQLLELPSPEGFSVVKPQASELIPSILDTPEQVYASAVEIRPAIQTELARLDVASTRIALAKGSMLPSISLSGGIGTNYYTSSRYASASFGQQAKNNFSQYLGLSLGVPIFTRFANRNSIRNAQLGYQAQELQLENAKKSLYKEIQQAWANAVASQAKLLSSQEAAASAEESFELVKAKYENGKASVTEFDQARNSLVRSQSDLVQAQYENYFNSRLLEFYKGVPLK